MRVVVVSVLMVVLVFGFGAFLEGQATGFAIKTLHKPELRAPADWPERRYVCDLPRRDDCVRCCEAVRDFTEGAATLVDFESCIVKLPKEKLEGAGRVWEDCIRVASGLAPKYVERAAPVIEAPREVLPLAPYRMCMLLPVKPRYGMVFFPFHPVMIASVVC